MHERGLRTTRTVVGHCDNVSAEMLIHSPSLTMSEGARHVAVNVKLDVHAGSCEQV